MPVMPASARAAISTFRELRTAHSVVSTFVTSECGWLIWTPMKISPAATAATPAARYSVLGVMVMSAPCRVGPRRSLRRYQQRRKRQGDPASPHDVIGDVTRRAGQTGLVRPGGFR